MLKRFAAVIAFLAWPCLSIQAGSSVQVIDHEDELVLKAALHSQCRSDKGYVLLSSMAAAPKAGDDLGGADESGAFDDLKRRNGSEAALPADLSCEGVRVHDEREIQHFFDRDSMPAEEMSADGVWKRFFESFPGSRGWMALSLPGYSPDRAIALVYIAHYCGNLCGSGSYVYLRRIEGQWRVLFSFPTWIS